MKLLVETVAALLLLMTALSSTEGQRNSNLKREHGIRGIHGRRVQDLFFDPRDYATARGSKGESESKGEKSSEKEEPKSTGTKEPKSVKGKIRHCREIQLLH